MSETEPIVVPLARKAGGDPSPSEGASRRGAISFDRRELSQILNVYGRKVASGEWRDYAIDTLREKAVFSVFRRSSEMRLTGRMAGLMKWLAGVGRWMRSGDFGRTAPM